MWPGKFMQSCRVNDCFHQIGSSCLFKNVLTQKACAILQGRILCRTYLNQVGSNNFWQLLTRQACTSLPGQKLFEPSWLNKSLTRQTCTGCWVKTILNQVGSTNDPASLYKLAGSKVCLNQVGSSNLWPGNIVQACQVKSVLSQGDSTNYLTWQACTSLPVQIYVEQIWFKLYRCVPHVYICVYMYYMFLYTHICISPPYGHCHKYIYIYIWNRFGLSVACARLLRPTCF